MVGIAADNMPPQCMIWCLDKCLLPCCPFAKLVPNNLMDTLTEDQHVQSLLDANPLRYDQLHSLCTAHTTLHTTFEVQRRAKELEMPILICHGDTDRVTDCEHSKMFMRECGAEEEDKTLKIYKGKGHLLFNEESDVFIHSVTWMMQRISQENVVENDDVNKDLESAAKSVIVYKNETTTL